MKELHCVFRVQDSQQVLFDILVPKENLVCNLIKAKKIIELAIQYENEKQEVPTTSQVECPEKK